MVFYLRCQKTKFEVNNKLSEWRHLSGKFYYAELHFAEFHDFFYLLKETDIDG